MLFAVLCAVACATTLASSAAARGVPESSGAVCRRPASELLLPPVARAAGVVPDDAGTVGDWKHAWQVVGLLQARPPRGRMVYYLGDSTARESIVSEASWTAQLKRLGAHGVRAYTLAGHGETFAMDARLVRALPRSRGLALIGVSLSRFIGPPVRGSAAHPARFPPGTAPRLSPWRQHVNDALPAMTQAEKRERVAHWRRTRTPAFFRYRAANLAVLGKLVQACRGRGLTPVLIDLPLNEAVVRHGLDAPRSSYRSGCRALTSRLGIRYVSFLHALGLPSSDFFDICHLVRSGYTKWQLRLSRAVAKLL
jgi:hypothetical protein